MRIGQYRHRITLQTATPARDSAGGTTRTYSTFATRWANVDALQGRELLQAQATKSAYTYKVTMRHLDSVAQSMRVVFGSKTLEIVSIIPDDTETELVLMCVEVK